MAWEDGRTLRGRIVRFHTNMEFNNGRGGAVVAPVDADNVRMMALSVPCYDNETTVVERNGNAV